MRLDFPRFIPALTLWAATCVAWHSDRHVNAELPNPITNSSTADDRTDAERIAGVKRLIASDTERQVRLARSAEQLNSRFDKLANQFTELDRRRAVAAASGRTQSTESQALLQREWTTARDNLDQLIRHRKLVQQQLKTLSDKVQLEHDYLRQLVQPMLADQPIAPVATALPVGASAAVPAQPSMLTSVMLPSPQAVSQAVAPAATPASSSTPAASASSLSETDERVVTAKRDQEAKQATLRAKRDRLQFVDRSIEVFERDLKNSRAILADAKELGESSSRRIKDQSSTGPADADAAVQQADALEEQAESQETVLAEATVIAETEAMVKRLHQSRDNLANEVSTAEQALSTAQTWTLLLESPLSPSRLVRWLTDHGPKVMSVLFVMLIMFGIARLIEHRILTGLMQRRNVKAGSSGRAETLRRVFHSFTNFAILTLGGLAALDQAGVNVTVLLGGAAVLGAAIAFGSQHLIRDFFSGFMILIENQYSVGHVVSINTKSGLVEDITLRMTVLRDEEGIVHFIPHSEATIVSNMTYGWARAVFDVAIDYRENVDNVMRILMGLAREMRNDPQYEMLIIDNPELQGVDRLGDSAVHIKFLIKTQPIQQWNVKRELLRRIKNKFNELGISFAFPQRELHFNSEELPSKVQREPETAGSVAGSRGQ